MIICTGGGTLVIAIPIAIVVIPIYLMISKQLLFGKRSTATTHVAETILGERLNEHGERLNTQQSISRNEDALVIYIQNARTYGATDSTIRNNLKTQGGWAEKDVNEAFSVLEGKNDTMVQ
jgi:hypothetical protein